MILSLLSVKNVLELHSDAKKSALAANLIYVNDSKPGIIRRRRGKGFIYELENKKITSEPELLRIKKLALPPAWENVWICTSPDGHLQATGIDKAGRKQYRYHERWNKSRNETKFHRMLEFGNCLPLLRSQIEKDMNQEELTQSKVIATVIGLMDRTYIRVGNSQYEKDHGSHGLTTLKNKHVKIEGNKIHFSFVGKKNVQHDITLRSKKLARIVKQCRDIPGRDLFQYKNGDGKYHVVDSGQVNNYIQTITGEDFSAKDFRTWAGTLHALSAFNKLLNEGNAGVDSKKLIAEVLDTVSNRLGNTRAVCKKYYVHPFLIELFENGKLNSYIKKLSVSSKNNSHSKFSDTERVMMDILRGLKSKSTLHVLN